MSESELMRAVGERRVVELRKADDLGSRRVHPHLVYRTATGEIAIDTYQVAGWSRSGELPGWRTFKPHELVAVRLLEERFAPAPGYDPASSKYRHGVLAAV